MPSQAASTPQPRQVSRFEANLLRILRFFFRQAPADEALPLIRDVIPRPPCLSSSAVELIRDTLAKGSVLYLVRSGGWKVESYLTNGEPKGGRLWQRRPIQERNLNFSAGAIEFLIWLTANRPMDQKPLTVGPATVADDLLFFLAYQSVAEVPDVAAALQALGAFSNNALCRLFYPGDFADTEMPAGNPFDRWMAGSGACIMEAMQSALAARWLEIEQGKGLLGDWDQMRCRGRAEGLVLQAFMEAADRAGRWDLARPLLITAGRILATPEIGLAFWTGGLQGAGPARLAERLEIQRHALALVVQVDLSRQWERRARSRGFFDEDYQAGKFWLGEWERLGGSLIVERAQQLLQALEPLRAN